LHCQLLPIPAIRLFKLVASVYRVDLFAACELRTRVNMVHVLLEKALRVRESRETRGNQMTNDELDELQQVESHLQWLLDLVQRAASMRAVRARATILPVKRKLSLASRRTSESYPHRHLRTCFPVLPQSWKRWRG